MNALISIPAAVQAKDKRPDATRYSYVVDKSFTNTMGAGWKKKTFETKYERLMCHRGYFGAPANDRLCRWLN